VRSQSAELCGSIRLQAVERSLFQRLTWFKVNRKSWGWRDYSPTARKDPR
jgi:hypothetical protein